VQKGQLQSFPQTDAGTSAVMSCELLLREVPRVLPSAHTMRSLTLRGAIGVSAGLRLPKRPRLPAPGSPGGWSQATETSAIVALEFVSV
jgi:hypothetical protein